MPVTFSKPLPQCHTKRDRDQVLALWSMIEKHLPQRSLKRVTHQLEFGAGKAEATRQAQDMKLQAIGCDRDDKCIEDGVVVKLNYTDAKGFGQSVRHVLRVVECGTVIFAIQCSSLVFLSRSTSGRDTWRPLGDTTMPFVKDGNSGILHASALCLLCYRRNVRPLVENPSSSILGAVPPFDLLVNLGILEVLGTTDLGAFQGESKKSLRLWSKEATAFAREHLCKKTGQSSKKKTNLVHVKKTATGVKVTGKKDALKQSQAYTPEFGRAISRVTRKSIADNFFHANGINWA